MPFKLPGTLPLPFEIAGRKAADWTLALKTEVVLVGAGALMSFRTAWSLLLGGLLTYGVLAPSLFESKAITAVSYKAIIGWTVWPVQPCSWPPDSPPSRSTGAASRAPSPAWRILPQEREGEIAARSKPSNVQRGGSRWDSPRSGRSWSS
jgi:hypothetical protein